MRYLLITFAALFLVGCVAVSDNPLTDPGKAQQDCSILGAWTWDVESSPTIVHIGVDEASNQLRIVMLEYDKHCKLDSAELSGHASTLKGNTYLNLKWVRPEENAGIGYMLVKYVVRSDALGIAFMDCGVLELAMRNGAIKGEIEIGGCPRITEGQKKLQEFISRKDKELFPEMVYMPKLKLPDQSSKQTAAPRR